MFDAILTVARVKLGTGDDWRWCESEMTNHGDFILKGACFPLHPKTGRPNYRAVKVRDLQTVVVTKSEIVAACHEYEQRTGTCSKCDGSGQVMHSYTTVHGANMVTCSRCSGTGKAKHHDK